MSISKSLGGTGTTVAIVLILIWLVGLGVLWFHLDDEAHWAKLLLIFNSVETGAFAAIGAILGVQVKRAENAEHAANKAKADMVQEKKISEIGSDLANSVLSEKDHIFQDKNDGGIAFHVNKAKTGDTRSIQLAQQLIDARRAANLSG
ncbi:hypothetical protein [Bradyrhizobium jicamae]|uniref:hypothetical protein n=1 Tax=Bradyrhizobium jicamae TaxID=280332 RepID=UPI001BA9DE1F|nr:hypothetical protein [Bradyrhizobium jicamae]MBR0939404.1 hypothetical protein [Bradyrhizobium jicamae]